VKLWLRKIIREYRRVAGAPAGIRTVARDEHPIRLVNCARQDRENPFFSHSRFIQLLVDQQNRFAALEGCESLEAVMFEPTGVINEIAVLASEHSLPWHRWPVAMDELRLRLADLCVCGCPEADPGVNGGVPRRRIE